jgi:hypothetical protein
MVAFFIADAIADQDRLLTIESRRICVENASSCEHV